MNAEAAPTRSRLGVVWGQLALPEHCNANYATAVEVDRAWRARREINEA
jgi:hypothetical protein